MTTPHQKDHTSGAHSSVSAQVFKSEVGPDGNARDELDVACTIDHPNLTKSLGIVRASNAKSGGARGDGVDNFLWLVMERVVGKPLAEKPDFSSVLRCRWGSGRRFEPVLVLAVLLQVGAARTAWPCICLATPAIRDDGTWSAPCTNT